MSLEQGLSSGTLLSCIAPGCLDYWPPVAPYQDTGGLFLGWLHHGGPSDALRHVGRATVLMHLYPHHLGVGKEVLASFPIFSTLTGDASHPVSHEFILCPGPAIPSSTCLHGSRYIRWGPLSCARLVARCMWASCRSLLRHLGESARLTRGNLWPPGQRYPSQVGAPVELAFPSYHCVIVAAMLYPLHPIP